MIMNDLLTGEKKLTSPPSISLMDALILLKKTGKKCIIIINKKKKLLGTLTDGDLRSLIISKKNLNQSIKKYYNNNPRYVEENKFNIEELRKEIIKDRLEVIPIVDSEKKVVDVLTWDRAFQNKFTKKQKLNCEVVIMAGGEGVRLQPFTSILPKPLIPVQGKSIIEHIIEQFSNIGVDRFNVSLGYKNQTIKAFFKALKLKFKINFYSETKPLGTIGSLSLLNKKKFLNKTIFVSNCDILIKSNLLEILNFHETKKNDITIVAAAKNILIPYGVCQTYKDGTFKTILEKPSYSGLMNTGLYLINSSILNFFSRNKKIDINDLVLLAKKKKKKIGLFPIPDELWVDIGQWNEYKIAAKKLEE